MKELTVFEFQGNKLRVIEHKGNPWFIANEVCKALGIANSWDAISRLSRHQKDDLGIPDAIGRTQKTNIISEGGLYKLAFRSHKEEAEVFTDLVVDEILPAIRKTGSYSMDSKSPVEQLQNQLGMLQFVHKIVRGVFRALSQRWIVENKQLALYGKVAFDYFRLEVMRANREYSAVVKYFHGDNVFDGLNVKGDIVKMQAEIKDGEVSVQMHFPFVEEAK